MIPTGSVLAVSFWCSASDRSWSWTPRPYLGAWLVVGALLTLALWWHRRGSSTDALVRARAGAVPRPATGPLAPSSAGAGDAGASASATATAGASAASAAPAVDENDVGEGATGPAPRIAAGPIEGSRRGRIVALALGALGLWACLDWPLATLGAGYLATAQMARQILMVMVVAPLLLFACPAPLAARLVGWGKRLTVLRWTARPVVAVPVAALTLVAVNAPAVVDPFLRTPYGAFVMDAAWTVAGFVLWMPVQCPHPGVRRLTGPTALVYLIGQSIVPVVPGFFMTWADFPIYRVYELAPRAVAGFDAVTDQQTAAAVLQVGGMALLWLQIAYRFLRWGYQQMEENLPARQAVPVAAPGAQRTNG